MSILTEILEGWTNYVFENPAVEEEAKRRIGICVENDCKQFKSNKCCNICGCFMPAKVRSTASRCPLTLW